MGELGSHSSTFPSEASLCQGAIIAIARLLDTPREAKWLEREIPEIYTYIPKLHQLVSNRLNAEDDIILGFWNAQQGAGHGRNTKSSECSLAAICI